MPTDSALCIQHFEQRSDFVDLSLIARTLSASAAYARSMPIQPFQNAQAGPSRPRPPPATQAGKPKAKTIAKTAELVARNERAKQIGRPGKTGDILGNVARAFATPSSASSGIAGNLKGKQKAVNLPGAIQVERFAEARAMEIMAFQQAIQSAAAFGNARVFQALPRHLRRRAASHNPTRVPKRVRSKAAAEIDPNSTIAKMHRKRAKLRAKGDRKGRSRTEQLALRQRVSPLSCAGPRC